MVLKWVLTRQRHFGRPYEHDVQKRIPDTRKAKDVLGFEATTPLETILDEVIPWVKEQIELGTI